ncbi:MAG: DUF4156 domain-containing protein [Tannerella sp.]|jgi:hypothetical protein|nr:DUF4156 domain-containing protein [Tannerella sp.]
MKHFAICILLMLGAIYNLHAQDKMVLRSGRAIEVHVQRSLEDRVEYTYPEGTQVYERPKTAISYILYENGRKEICDNDLRESSSNNRSSSSTRVSSSSGQGSSSRTPAARNKLSNDDEIFWQDVKTTFTESDVRGMTRLNRVSAKSSISYKDAIQQLKKKAAAIGGTTILVMDVPESEGDEDIEVIGIAYRDENMQYTPRSASDRNSAPTESSSNVRRRRIAQQMEGYNNESNLQFEDHSDNTASRNTRSASSRNTQSSSSSRETSGSGDSPDAVYLTNGRIIRGVIEEFEPDDFVSIRTPAGKVYEYSGDDVKRVSRGRSSTAKRSSSRYDDNDQYGGRSSSSRNNNYKISGYKGTFDAGYDLAIGGTGEKGNFEINTSHGYQINEYLFVGAGLGLHIYNARDINMKDTASYPQYIGTQTNGIIRPLDSVTYLHAVDSSYMALPIFLDIRGYYPIPNSPITPFAMLRVGYAFNLSDGFGGMGLYMNPTVGVKYQVSPMLGISFSIGYAYQSYGGIPANGGYGYYYYKSQADKSNDVKYEAKGAGGVSLKLGIEF